LKLTIHFTEIQYKMNRLDEQAARFLTGNPHYSDIQYILSNDSEMSIHEESDMAKSRDEMVCDQQMR